MILQIQSSPIVQAIGWTLLHSLWQITLIGFVLWIILNFLSKKSAQQSYIFSVGALFLIAVSVGLTFTNYFDFTFSNNEITKAELTDLMIPNNRLNQSPTIETTPVEIVPMLAEKESFLNLENLLPFFVLAWMIGVFIFAIRFITGWLHLRRLKKTMLSPADFKWQKQLNQFAEKMGIQKQVQFFVSEKMMSPVTFGHFKPIILFPASMLTGLSAGQIEMLLLHELAHIRRADFAINLLQSLIEVVLFYHPVVWWISKQIRITREHCCDDIAVAACNNHFEYAQTLTQIQTSIFLKKNL